MTTGTMITVWIVGTWTVPAIYPPLHGWGSEPPHFRTMCALIGDEAGKDGYYHRGVERALPSIDQHRSQQEVVDKEDDQIDGKHLPDHQYLWPVKDKHAVVHRTDIHA